MGNLASYDKAILLMPMNGSNGSETFVDLSKDMRTFTPSGTPTQATIAGNLYATGGYFPGDSVKYLKVSSDDDFNLNGLGTVQLWVYLSDLSKDSTMLYYGIYGNNEPWSILYMTATNKLRCAQSGGTDFSSDELTGLTTGWHHIALCGDGAKYWWWLDGAQVGYRNSGTSFPDAASDLWIGGMSWESTSRQNIYIQDLVIHKGVALYQSAFTPPGKLIGTISNAGSGIAAIKDDADAAAIRRVWATQRLAAGRIFETTSDSDGRYSLTVPHTEHDVVFEDNAAGTEYSDILVSHVTPT
jgi:hypothetical protein